MDKKMNLTQSKFDIYFYINQKFLKNDVGTLKTSKLLAYQVINLYFLWENSRV